MGCTTGKEIHCGLVCYCATYESLITAAMTWGWKRKVIQVKMYVYEKNRTCSTIGISSDGAVEKEAWARREKHLTGLLLCYIRVPKLDDLLTDFTEHDRQHV